MTYSSELTEALEKLDVEYSDVIDDKPHKKPSACEISIDTKRRSHIVWRNFWKEYEYINDKNRICHLHRRRKYHSEKATLFYYESIKICNDTTSSLTDDSIIKDMAIVLSILSITALCLGGIVFLITKYV